MSDDHQSVRRESRLCRSVGGSESCQSLSNLGNLRLLSGRNSDNFTQNSVSVWCVMEIGKLERLESCIFVGIGESSD